MNIAQFLFQGVLMVIGISAGFACLLYGRQRMDILLASAGLYLGLLIGMEANGYERVWDLVTNQRWLLLLAAVVVCTLGWVTGQLYKNIAIIVVGLGVGAIIFFFVDEIILFASGLSPETAPQSEWWMLFVLLGFMLGSLYLTRRYIDTALILYATWIGSRLIIDSLRLDSDKPIVAIITLSLLLLGVVYQFAQFLREQPRPKAGEYQPLPDIR